MPSPPNNIQAFCRQWLHYLRTDQHQAFLRDLASLLKPPSDEVLVESIVSNRTKDPLVSVRMGPYEFQVAPEEARRIGRSFEDAASAAETDAFVVRFFGQMELPAEAAGAFLVELRQYRATRAEDEVRAWREREKLDPTKAT